MLGAMIYLVGSEEHRLEWPYEDFEVWLYDMRGRIERVIHMV